ncbi:hypothetical protein D3C76_1541350 [compost metagenome]
MVPQILGHRQGHTARGKTQGAGHDVVAHFVMGDLQGMIAYCGGHLPRHFHCLATFVLAFDYE